MGGRRLILARDRLRESSRGVGDVAEGVRDVRSARPGDRSVQPPDRGVESIPKLARSPAARTRPKLIRRFGVLGAGNRPPQQTCRMRVLPRDLLAFRGLGKSSQPGRKIGVRWRKLVRPHRFGPGVAGVTHRPHDVRPLAVEKKKSFESSLSGCAVRAVICSS